MTLVALLSLAFSGWMAFTLAASLREEKLSGFTDYLSTLWIGAGTFASIATVLWAVFK
jgi:hypothetical protein